MFKKVLMVSISAVIPSFAQAVDTEQCPSRVFVALDQIQARVNSSFKRDQGYVQAVETLNRINDFNNVYVLTKRVGQRCEYVAEKGSYLSGSASLYSKSVFDSDKNRFTNLDTLHVSFFNAEVPTRFGLFMEVESYTPNGISVHGDKSRTRTLMALLVDRKSGKASYRRSGQVRFSVR